MTRRDGADEQRGLERPIQRARLVGAGLAVLLGPLFPNLGIAHVLLLGLLLFTYGTFFLIWEDRARSEREERVVARASFAADAALVAYAMFVFAPDPLWTTFVIGNLIVIIGAFRFARAGAIASTASMSLAYVAVAIFRDRVFGFPFDPARAAFHVSAYVLTALLAYGILRELHALRRQREDVVQRAVDAREARRSAERLRAVLDSALDAVVGMSRDGAVIEWNPQAQTLFGWSREEVIGMRLAEMIIPPRYRQAHQDGLARYLATGDGPVLGRRVELEAVRRDGTEVPVELSIVAIDTDGRQTFSAFVRDLTDRRRLDAAARRDFEREEAERARSALLARMSHEFRTPLNAILGFSELLDEQAGASLDGRHRRYLENIRASGRQMLALVDDLLGLAKQEARRDG